MFGAYSALITVLMTTALLQKVATTAKPKKDSQDLRQETKSKYFYYIATTYSVLAQIFCISVNTFAPHGILSALRLIKVPFERIFQGMFGILSMGGAIIITKLQSESAEDIIKDTPSSKSINKTCESIKDGFFNLFRGKSDSSLKEHSMKAQ